MESDTKPRKILQIGNDLLVEGSNGLWYELREAVTGGHYIDELRRDDVIVYAPREPAPVQTRLTCHCGTTATVNQSAAAVQFIHYPNGDHELTFTMNSSATGPVTP